MEEEGGDERELGLRERRKIATRRALLEAALALVVEHGFEKVTVEAISEAAGVSPRTFFNYFAAKEDALTESGTEGVARICRRVRVLPAHLDAMKALEVALEAELRLVQDDPVTLLQLRVLERTPALFPRMMALGEAAVTDLSEAVADRVGVPASHPFPSLAAVVALTTFRLTFMKWHHEGRPGDPADHLTQAFARLRAGLPDPPPSSD